MSKIKSKFNWRMLKKKRSNGLFFCNLLKVCLLNLKPVVWQKPLNTLSLSEESCSGLSEMAWITVPFPGLQSKDSILEIFWSLTRYIRTKAKGNKHFQGLTSGWRSHTGWEWTCPKLYALKQIQWFPHTNVHAHTETHFTQVEVDLYQGN